MADAIKPDPNKPDAGKPDAGTTQVPSLGEFVHLHLHTEYSLLDGGNQIERLIDRVAELGMKACGITDHGNLFGAVAFAQAAKDKGIKPILGIEAYVTPPDKPRTDRTYTGGGEGGFHLVLLAQTTEGWNNLMYLSSEAFLTGFYYKPRIDREILGAHSAGLIAINGHLGSEIGEHLDNFVRSGDTTHWDRAVESARWHCKAFARGASPVPRFYVELQHHIAEQNRINPHLIRLWEQMKAEFGEGEVGIIATNDAHFLKKEDHDAHDTLICISTGKSKNDPDRMHYPFEVYVKSPAEMREVFAEYGEVGRQALEATVKIAESCNAQLAIGANHAPAVRIDLPEPAKLPRHDDEKFGGDLTAWYKAYCAAFELKPFEGTPTAADVEASKKACDAALRMLAEAGYIWRYGAATDEKEHTERQARLNRELKILADKNISAYFLIVWDFVNWGRQRGIPANARGSGVGTMVGYVLGLSNACPVRYSLLFERFTDPDRSEYPDIDIDLCQDGRGEVIDYVRKKYGHVAQIITFGTMKARAAVRDVARALDMPLGDADKLAKLIPETLNITLDEALEQEPELKKRYDQDPLVKRLIDTARTLEGQARHASVHAAGVIVATRPLHEIVPLYRPSGTDDTVTQWDGPTCEKMGLLKMDFLGLRTLSVVERAKKLIRESMSEEQIWEAVGRGAEFRKWSSGQIADATQRPPHPLDLDRLTFDDPKVFTMFQRGDTTGVFQFESGGMRRLLTDMKPDRLEDLIAANALFRPGPMDLIPDYNRRKHGTAEVPKVHDIVDRYTAETYGVMVYQEQVMQIVHGLGGIKLRDAYTLIKNISKKKHDKIEKERPKFVDGAQKQGLTKAGAEELFELILKFAGYGFNKSHSTGYAIVAYQTAYLKTYFPNQYMAAFLTYESQASAVADWVPYLEDCKKTRFIDPASAKVVKTGVEVRPPDVNLSQADFSVVFGSGDNPEALRAHQGHVRFGLNAIKGVSEKTIAAVIAERPKNGPYTSIFDFCERILAFGAQSGQSQVLNKGTLEALIKCGAFDSVHERANRAAMLATVEQAMQGAAKAAVDKAAGQNILFGGGGGGGATQAPAPATPLARATPWSEAETLAKEKESLGLYVSSHPLDAWRAWTGVFATADAAMIRDKKHDDRVIVAALVQSVRTIVTRNGASAGQKMAIVTAEDLTGVCEAVLFSEAYVRFSHLLEADKPLFVLGRVDTKRGGAQVIVERLVPIDGVPLQPGRLRVFFDDARLNGSGPAAARKAAQMLADAMIAPPAEAPLFPLDLFVLAGERYARLEAPKFIRTPLTPELVTGLEQTLGPGSVKLHGGVWVDTLEKRDKPWMKKKEGASVG